ncbi:MAG TPA: response regulator transcription factor [Roseiflexaceae bacterium]|nr:response regulator transcription factor [Roseiflexaceae bacterium]
MIRLLVVDDQPAVRAGLRMRLALEPDIEVVGEAEDGAAALAQAARLRPDVVLMDIEMPRMDGLAATAALRAVAPESAVVILSLHDSQALRAHARSAGAAAFVAKHESEAALLHAIRTSHTSQSRPAPV